MDTITIVLIIVLFVATLSAFIAIILGWQGWGNKSDDRPPGYNNDDDCLLDWWYSEH
ncbi:hypothetical protein KKF05_03995 [Patescibacteria group bacterium]|nr:hypothetical protein [Patescibacteria group bacterium]MBU1028625.1 hypothetical protein [Patescibacteria group bacterium]